LKLPFSMMLHILAALGRTSAAISLRMRRLSLSEKLEKNSDSRIFPWRLIRTMKCHPHAAADAPDAATASPVMSVVSAAVLGGMLLGDTVAR
jgi:hypothetical protein